MMIRKTEFLARAKISEEALDVWIEEAWLVPQSDTAELAFSELDVARARLIQDLMHDLGVNREGVGIILNLLDQMHGMRRALRGALESPAAPSDGRSEVAAD